MGLQYIGFLEQAKQKHKEIEANCEQEEPQQKKKYHENIVESEDEQQCEGKNEHHDEGYGYGNDKDGYPQGRRSDDSDDEIDQLEDDNNGQYNVLDYGQGEADIYSNDNEQHKADDNGHCNTDNDSHDNGSGEHYGKIDDSGEDTMGKGKGKDMSMGKGMGTCKVPSLGKITRTTKRATAGKRTCKKGVSTDMDAGKSVGKGACKVISKGTQA
ncbi:hypothetical protein C0995_016274 [Termitomyces sp. Mi166|nr:hypothetical protein C0995_016274 [Termitomyces sp. Mi166\